MAHLYEPDAAPDAAALRQLLSIYFDPPNVAAAASGACGTRLDSAARRRHLHKHAGRPGQERRGRNAGAGTLSKQPERRQLKNSTQPTGKESKVNSVVTASGNQGRVSWNYDP